MSRILIAEDDVNIASFIQKGLHSAGFVTTHVADGGWRCCWPAAVASTW